MFYRLHRKTGVCVEIREAVGKLDRTQKFLNLSEVTPTNHRQLECCNFKSGIYRAKIFNETILLVYVAEITFVMPLQRSWNLLSRQPD